MYCNCYEVLDICLQTFLIKCHVNVHSKRSYVLLQSYLYNLNAYYFYFTSCILYLFIDIEIIFIYDIVIF